MMLASGFAGLALQIVWTQQCALWLGHEAPAVLAVVSAFFGGLAAGAWLTGERIERSAHPARWYAACELLIAAWTLVLLFVLPAYSDALTRLTGVQPSALRQWSLAFFGTFAILLPATAAMGATLPAIERAFEGLAEQGGAHQRRRSIARLYAANTLGAVLGVLASAFWLVPALGLRATSLLCLSLNAACALAALLMPPVAARPDASPPRAPLVDARLGMLAVTGFLGIGYEVLVVRVLSQVNEDTVYTFALLLAVYLAGSAGGAAAWQRWRGPRDSAASGASWLTCALAAACALSAAALWFAEDLRNGLLDLLGHGMDAALGAEAGLALAVFALPTFVMGALFSQLAADAKASGQSFGRVLGANTLGAALAPPCFGVWALPAWGPKFALLAVICGYLLLSLRAWRKPAFWLAAGAMLVLAAWAPRLAFVEVPEGGRIVSYREGVLGAVSVVEDADGIARLRIDNRQQEGSSATLRVDGRQALIPLLLHPSPRHALFLGLGTGVTASAAARDPALVVDVVELLPEVVEASESFTQSLPSDGRLQILVADARRYVRASDRRYDVIVADNFHPARSGAGSLYTVEHFTAIRARLAAGGVFCQWLPLHQLDLDTLRSIVHSFMTVYPDGWAILASNSLETPVIGLVAHADGARFDPPAASARIAAATFTPGPAELGIEDEFALFGSFIAGPGSLRAFAAGSPLNTDDHPMVAYLAPRITYAPDSLPRERLATLLGQVSIDPHELVAQSSDTAWMHRLAAYWQARNLFIESGQTVRPSRDVREMLAQVRAPLLSVLHASPDFRPAYDPLLMMANALAQTDAAAARGLLVELAAVQPARVEAQRALLELEPAITQPSLPVHLTK